MSGGVAGSAAAAHPRGAERPSAPRLPPLNLFRTFDAAARHCSFRLAAEELCVTPSAISQQIRQLEEFLGAQLFRRLPRRVELTREGLSLGATVKDVLAMLSASCDRFRDPAAPALVCVSVTPTLGMRWLVSRLRRFAEQHSAIRLSLVTSNDPIDFERQDIDLGLRWGRGFFPGMRSERLTRDIVFPVCNPEFIDVSRLRTPEDAKRHTLLQATHNGVTWATWFDRVGVATHAPDILHYNDTVMMLEAIACGQGIGLSSSLLSENDLRAGRLVRVFDLDVEIDDGYYLLSPDKLADTPAVAQVREWLHSEATHSIQAVNGRPTELEPLP